MHALVKHEFRWQLSSWDDMHSIFILNQTHAIRGAVTVWRLKVFSVSGKKNIENDLLVRVLLLH
jgi:hypothetical protein